MGLTIQTIHQKVKVVKQTIEELMADNKEFLEWLKSYFGDETRDRFVEYLKTELSFVPPTGTEIEMELVKLGDGTIIYSPYTVAAISGVPKDPVNLIFHNGGSADAVADIMCKQLNPKWYNVWIMTSSQYAYIDDAAHGGSTEEKDKWIKVSKSLSDKPFDGILRHRKHLRIFESPTGCTHQYGNGKYSIASVHKDHRICHFLSPLDFVTSRLEVERAFSGKKFITVEQIDHPDTKEFINGTFHDGKVCYIEIKKP